MTDAELAAHLAECAGRILLEVRATGMFEGKALGKAGDETANQFLVHALRAQRPDDGLLSEESKDTDERLAKERVWIIDPVDGTREYGEERSRLGGACRTGDRRQRRKSARSPCPASAIVLRTDQPGHRARSRRTSRAWSSAARARRPKRSPWPKRSAASWCRWAAPGPRPWRWSAARRRSTCIRAASTNGTAARLPRLRRARPALLAASTASPLVYNQRDTYMPDLLICRPEWAERVLAEVAAL